MKTLVTENPARAAHGGQIAASAGKLAGALLVVGILLLDRLNPQLDPVAAPISHMGAVGAPYAAAFNWLLATCALLIAACALGLGRALRARQLPVWPAALLAAFGLLGLGGSAAFHCRAGCEEVDLLGMLHFVPTTLGLAALLLAIAVMPGYLAALGAGDRSQRLALWAGQLALASTALYALAVLLPDPFLFPYIGLIQRTFMLAFASWLYAVTTPQAIQKPNL
jgi:hypothetical protein